MSSSEWSEYCKANHLDVNDMEQFKWWQENCTKEDCNDLSIFDCGKSVCYPVKFKAPTLFCKTARFCDDVSVKNLSVCHDLDVKGKTTLTDVCAENLTLSEDLDVKGKTTLTDVCAENLTLSEDLNVTGKTMLTDVCAQNLVLSEDLDVTGKTTLNSLEVNGPVIFNDSVKIRCQKAVMRNSDGKKGHIYDFNAVTRRPYDKYPTEGLPQYTNPYTIDSNPYNVPSSVLTSSNGGFAAGPNGWGDLAKVNRFADKNNYLGTMTKVFFKWATTEAYVNNPPVGTFKIVVYNEVSGLPGTLIGESLDIEVSSIIPPGVQADVPYVTDYINIYDKSTGPPNPIVVNDISSDAFYVGVDFSGMYIGGTTFDPTRFNFGLLNPDDTTINRGFELYGGQWSAMSGFWPGLFDLAIVPDLDFNFKISLNGTDPGLYANIASWNWTAPFFQKESRNELNTLVLASSTDSDGNIYMAGFASYPATIFYNRDANVAMSTEFNDGIYFVGSVDSNGVWRWISQYRVLTSSGAVSNQYSVYDLKVSNDRVYICGAVNIVARDYKVIFATNNADNVPDLIFGNGVNNINSGAIMSLDKCTGQWISRFKLESISVVDPIGLFVDPDNNCAVTGRFAGATLDVYVENDNTPSVQIPRVNSGRSGFIIRFKPSTETETKFEYEWYVQILGGNTSSRSAYFGRIAGDDEYLYVYGYNFVNSGVGAKFLDKDGSPSSIPDIFSASTSNNFFIAKLGWNTNPGIWQWRARSSGTGSIIAKDIIYNPDIKKCYLVGPYIAPVVSFYNNGNDVTPAMTLTRSVSNRNDSYVASIDENGKWEWRCKISSNISPTLGSDIYGLSLCFDADKNLYVSVYSGPSSNRAIKFYNSNDAVFNTEPLSVDISTCRLSKTGNWISLYGVLNSRLDNITSSTLIPFNQVNYSKGQLYQTFTYDNLNTSPKLVDVDFGINKTTENMQTIENLLGKRFKGAGVLTISFDAKYPDFPVALQDPTPKGMTGYFSSESECEIEYDGEALIPGTLYYFDPLTNGLTTEKNNLLIGVGYTDHSYLLRVDRTEEIHQKFSATKAVTDGDYVRLSSFLNNTVYAAKDILRDPVTPLPLETITTKFNNLCYAVDPSGFIHTVENSIFSSLNVTILSCYKSTATGFFRVSDIALTAPSQLIFNVKITSAIALDNVNHWIYVACIFTVSNFPYEKLYIGVLRYKLVVTEDNLYSYVPDEEFNQDGTSKCILVVPESNEVESYAYARIANMDCDQNGNAFVGLSVMGKVYSIDAEGQSTLVTTSDKNDACLFCADSNGIKWVNVYKTMSYNFIPTDPEAGAPFYYPEACTAVVVDPRQTTNTNCSLYISGNMALDYEARNDPIQFGDNNHSIPAPDGIDTFSFFARINPLTGKTIWVKALQPINPTTTEPDLTPVSFLRLNKFELECLLEYDNPYSPTSNPYIGNISGTDASFGLDFMAGPNSLLTQRNVNMFADKRHYEPTFDKTSFQWFTNFFYSPYADPFNVDALQLSVLRPNSEGFYIGPNIYNDEIKAMSFNRTKYSEKKFNKVGFAWGTTSAFSGYTGGSSQTFTINVWDDNGGLPGDIISTSGPISVDTLFDGSELILIDPYDDSIFKNSQQFPIPEVDLDLLPNDTYYVGIDFTNMYPFVYPSTTTFQFGILNSRAFAFRDGFGYEYYGGATGAWHDSIFGGKYSVAIIPNNLSSYIHPGSFKIVVYDEENSYPKNLIGQSDDHTINQLLSVVPTHDIGGQSFPDVSDLNDVFYTSPEFDVKNMGNTGPVDLSLAASNAFYVGIDFSNMYDYSLPQPWRGKFQFGLPIIKRTYGLKYSRGFEFIGGEWYNMLFTWSPTRVFDFPVIPNLKTIVELADGEISVETTQVPKGCLVADTTVDLNGDNHSVGNMYKSCKTVSESYEPENQLDVKESLVSTAFMLTLAPNGRTDNIQHIMDDETRVATGIATTPDNELVATILRSESTRTSVAYMKPSGSGYVVETTESECSRIQTDSQGFFYMSGNTESTENKIFKYTLDQTQLPFIGLSVGDGLSPDKTIVPKSEKEAMLIPGCYYWNGAKSLPSTYHAPGSKYFGVAVDESNFLRN